MQVTSSINHPLTSGVNNKPTTPIKNSVHTSEPISEVDQEQSSNKQKATSIVIDEQAIALFEENQASQSSKKSASFTSQDQPSAQNETAVASYQAVGNLAQRESVQKLLGVDLFA